MNEDETMRQEISEILKEWGKDPNAKDLVIEFDDVIFTYSKPKCTAKKAA